MAMVRLQSACACNAPLATPARQTDDSAHRGPAFAALLKSVPQHDGSKIASDTPSTERSSNAFAARSQKFTEQTLPPAATSVALSQQRAFRFSELGLFGLVGDEGRAEDAETPVGLPQQTNVPSALAPTGSDPSGVLDAANDPVPERPSLLPSAMAAPRYAQGLRAEAKRAADCGFLDGPIDGAAASGGLVGEASESESGSSGDAKTPASAAEQDGQNAIQVAVSGPDQTLAIVARVAGEPGGNNSQIRQLVEQTVAEFDMRLGEFQLNGAPSPSTSSLGRSSHGSHTR